MTAAISCGSAATAQAGAEVLRAGGNAVDAVIAAAFASTVAEPGVSSLGGGGFLLVRQASGACVLLDFFTSVPSGPRGPVETVTVRYAGTTQDFHVGPQTVAVPGCLDGFLGAHARWGDCRCQTLWRRPPTTRGREWSSMLVPRTRWS